MGGDEIEQHLLTYVFVLRDDVFKDLLDRTINYGLNVCKLEL